MTALHIDLEDFALALTWRSEIGDSAHCLGAAGCAEHGLEVACT